MVGAPSNDAKQGPGPRGPRRCESAIWESRVDSRRGGNDKGSLTLCCPSRCFPSAAYSLGVIIACEGHEGLRSVSPESCRIASHVGT